MNKQTGAIILVAGTCIGSGMIALPMVLSRIGLIPSILLMLLTWGIIYYTALINLEINLQAGKAMSLGELGNKFSGKIAQLIGTCSFKILSFALVAVYIYAGSSVLQKMVEFSSFNFKLNFLTISTMYALVALILLLIPIKFIDYLNRLLFITLLAVIAILVAGLFLKINWSNLPLFSQDYNKISPWIVIAPVLFTSFGFHGSLPTLIKYCNNDKKILKKVFLWGCCIPSIVYIIWTFGVLSVVHNESPLVYQHMLKGTLDVGDLVKELSMIVNSKYVQILIWWISLLAIVTSLIGVGISLCETIHGFISTKIQNNALATILSATITILPSYLMAILVPNAFITVLGFAGMILAIIAILLPIYLLKKIKNIKLHCTELKEHSLIMASASVGLIIIACELLNML